MHIQPIVFRLHFHTAEAAQAAQDKLENFGFFPDFARSGSSHDQLGPYKLIFAHNNLREAKAVLGKTKLAQGYVDMFNPSASWQDGFVAVK